MIIGTIINGIVIDHIPAKRGMDLYRYLHLDRLDCEVALIENAPSNKLGRKDILKINEVLDLNIDILGFIDPHITINFIENGVKVRKLHPTPPDTVTNVIACKNPRCITSCERGIDQIFRLSDAEHGIYRCQYCETVTDKKSFI